MTSSLEIFENSPMKRTTVNVPELAYEEFQKRGINFSLFVRRAMKAMIGDYFEDVEVYLKREMLIDEQKRIDEKINNINNQIIHLNNRKNKIDEQIRHLDLQHVAAQRAADLSQLTRTLNKVITGCNFNAGLVEETAPDILEQMKSLNPEFNLPAYIERMKDILDF